MILKKKKKTLYAQDERNNISAQKAQSKSTRTDLGKLIFMICVDTEAGHGSAGEAGAVRQFPYSTDVTHRFVFQCRRRDFHLVLLVYGLVNKHT